MKLNIWRFFPSVKLELVSTKSKYEWIRLKRNKHSILVKRYFFFFLCMCDVAFTFMAERKIKTKRIFWYHTWKKIYYSRFSFIFICENWFSPIKEIFHFILYYFEKIYIYRNYSDFLFLSKIPKEDWSIQNICLSILLTKIFEPRENFYVLLKQIIIIKKNRKWT